MHKRGSWGNRRRGRGNRGNRGANNNRFTRPPKYVNEPEQLLEPEVGISEYMNDLEGFSGIIKARYSDFHVNEIDNDGVIAKITDTKIPEEFVLPKVEVPKDTPLEEISQEQWDSIVCMIESVDENGIKIKIDIDSLDKEKRAQVHRTVKNIFRDKIVSTTVVEDGKKFIELKKFNKNNDTRSRINEWPPQLGEYVYFLLYKESLDTMDAIIKIASALHINAASFNYAGVKDRRAKTTQWISVRKVEPWKLLIKTKSIRSVKIGNLKFRNEPLKLGQLTGNKFQIALRNITADEKVIDATLEWMKDNGFINYYGLQRFGSDKEVPTYEIGIKLLQGNFKEACNLILKPKKCEDPQSDIYKAKKVYQETGNAKSACIKIASDGHASLETKLLVGLSKTASTDYVNALESIPRNMRLLYIHSFQSMIWNLAVSKRIKDFGLKPVVGDLVLLDNEKIVKEEIEDEAEDPETDKTIEQVKVLTDDDLNNYTMYDIVLPLPGYNVVYPNHLKDYYKDLLGKYELDLEMPMQKVKSYTLSGNYRKVISKVANLEWKFINYKEPNDTLIRSDFEELLGHSEPKNPSDGPYKSLVISFSLNTSSYATMVLREILKMDTSSRSQAKLNDYHQPKTAAKEEPPIEEEVNSSSLLTDKDKFEAFKKAVFASTTQKEEPLKRKNENDSSQEETKKLKMNDEAGIKTQASLL